MAVMVTGWHHCTGNTAVFLVLKPNIGAPTINELQWTSSNRAKSGRWLLEDALWLLILVKLNGIYKRNSGVNLVKRCTSLDVVSLRHHNTSYKTSHSGSNLTVGPVTGTPGETVFECGSPVPFSRSLDSFWNSLVSACWAVVLLRCQKKTKTASPITVNMKTVHQDNR